MNWNIDLRHPENSIDRKRGEKYETEVRNMATRMKSSNLCLTDALE